jgi:hypothetical protein
MVACTQLEGDRLVPEEFIPPGTPWPKYPVKIRLRNRKGFSINYSYSEQGVEKTGTLKPFGLGSKQTAFIVNEPYSFSLRVGRRIVPVRYVQNEF